MKYGDVVRRGRGSEDEGAPSGGFHARIEFPEALNRYALSSGTCEAGAQEQLRLIRTTKRISRMQ